jgi:sugar phosphate permease
LSLGVFATSYCIGYVISNAFGGFSADRIGGRRILSISMLGADAFMLLFGATTSAALGITVQAIIGLFAGADYVAGIKLLASWFEPRELGMVMGVFTTATSLGTVIANAIVPSLIEKSS